SVDDPELIFLDDVQKGLAVRQALTHVIAAVIGQCINFLIRKVALAQRVDEGPGSYLCFAAEPFAKCSVAVRYVGAEHGARHAERVEPESRTYVVVMGKDKSVEMGVVTNDRRRSPVNFLQEISNVVPCKDKGVVPV